MSSRPEPTAALSRSSGIARVAGPYGEHGVPVADHPGLRPVDVLSRDGQRGQRPVVQVDPPVPFGVGNHRMAAVAVEPGGQLPVADQIAVGPDDDRLPGPELPPECRCRTHCPRRARPVRVQLQPGDRLGEPSVEVVPGVGEPEGDDLTFVVLELPEDVAGAETAGDEQDQLLRQGTIGTNHAGVGQDIGQGGRIGVRSPSQDPAGVDHRPGMILVPGAPDQLGPGGGVPLAGGGHPYPDACLELLLRGHIETFRPRPDAELHALETSPRPSWKMCASDGCHGGSRSPLCSRVAEPRGGSVREFGGGPAVPRSILVRLLIRQGSAPPGRRFAG